MQMFGSYVLSYSIISSMTENCLDVQELKFWKRTKEVIMIIPIMTETLK
jgi:hypothetical protein